MIFGHRSFDGVDQTWSGNGSIGSNVTYTCPFGLYFNPRNLTKESMTTMCKDDGSWSEKHDNLTCYDPRTAKICNSLLLPRSDGFGAVLVEKNGTEDTAGYFVKYLYEQYTEVYRCLQNGEWEKLQEGPQGEFICNLISICFQQCAYLFCQMMHVYPSSKRFYYA